MYPSLVLENQFGEVSNNFVKGGSSQVYCSFIVDVANGNGLGIRSLKGKGVANVYMHTSSTPDAANPNPASGYAIIEFEQGYADYLSGQAGFVAPVSGTPINVTTGVTAGLAYVIVSLGTTVAAQWQHLGLPANLVPAVGMSFIAPANNTATGTGTIEVQKATGSGVDHAEIVGNPSLTVSPADGSAGSMILVFLGATSSSVTTFRATAPSDETVVGLTFNLVPNSAPLI